jgi:hypothetical protein
LNDGLVKNLLDPILGGVVLPEVDLASPSWLIAFPESEPRKRRTDRAT